MSAGKMMDSIFWDPGVLLMDYLDKDHSITGAFYADLLTQIREKIKQIRYAKLTRWVLLHKDNILVHTSTVALADIQKCVFQLIELIRIKRRKKSLQYENSS